ncbi:alpha/beta hydrolase [Micromonospora sp. WMMD1155]|uniref:alpha/beta fold hydrolase n=1 Tax=Micromonospora sp. WMMD1155 TaxID=3016094 RepID=UPI00249A928C|nr:alpha/beta hydrolase [Micromonospora sp. WMMD1155]WFE53228.1 alpha/beta hydrolase [Micromonospora sp. WMMD1155]
MRSGLAETQFVETPDGRIAYRRFGRQEGVPLVLAMRFRGTMDHWDPALLDALAAHHDVIVFDNVGTAASTGEAPDSVDGLARGLLGFVEALGFDRVDLLGWSMGGYVVQAAALQQPERIRRLVVAGSGPGTAPGVERMTPEIMRIATKSTNDDEDFLRLFFPTDAAARHRGLASLRRLDARLDTSGAVVAADTVRRQLAVIQGVGTTIWDRLDQLTQPVLLATGVQDVMISAYGNFLMAQRLPNARLLIYGDAGHGFLFQHAEEFADDVHRFLSRQ